jgi:predicted RNA binding protein YcfA (HicA-like mRNA interferase family)
VKTAQRSGNFDLAITGQEHIRKMSRISGIPHARVIRAPEKAGFRVARQGRHIVMTGGRRIVTVPRHDPVNSHTLGGMVRDAGLTVEEFRGLL